MNLKINPVSESAISVQIEKEDYSIADVVHRELLNVKHVKFAGVPPPHPLIKTLTIQVHTDGSKPAKALIEAIEISQGRVAELLSESRRVFPVAPSEHVNTTESQSTQSSVNSAEPEPKTDRQST